MNLSFSDLRKGLNPLIMILALFIVLCLSGCVQPPSFNPEQAVFYNPITNETGSLSIRNLNGSNHSFHHMDQIEVLVGLKDSQESLGVNYSLILVFNFTYRQWEDRHNLTEQYEFPLTTNNTGFARNIFLYDQYTWPRGISEGKGQFEISCACLPNVTALSDTVTFYYYHKEISRHATVEGGLNAISNLENRNLIEEALSFGGNDSTYSNWDTFFHKAHYVVINTSTIAYFSTLQDAHDVEFQYEAWAIDLKAINLSYSQLTTTCAEYWGEYFPKISDIYIYEDWFISGPLSQINISDGWLILQYLLYESFTHDIQAWVLQIYQLALLTPDLSLQWLISSTNLVMA